MRDGGQLRLDRLRDAGRERRPAFPCSDLEPFGRDVGEGRDELIAERCRELTRVADRLVVKGVGQMELQERANHGAAYRRAELADRVQDP